MNENTFARVELYVHTEDRDFLVLEVGRSGGSLTTLPFFHISLENDQPEVAAERFITSLLGRKPDRVQLITQTNNPGLDTNLPFKIFSETLYSVECYYDALSIDLEPNPLQKKKYDWSSIAGAYITLTRNFNPSRKELRKHIFETLFEKELSTCLLKSLRAMPKRPESA